MATTFREVLGLPPSKAVQEARALTAEAIESKQGAYRIVQEGMMGMLSIALEDRGWIRTDGFAREGDDNHLTFAAIRAAMKHARALVQGNPIMASAVAANFGYRWGNGVKFEGDRLELITDKSANRDVLFSEAARVRLQTAKITDGNVLVLIEGRIASLIPFYEIEGAIYDPDDQSKILYFYRRWMTHRTDFETMATQDVEMKRLYPNMAIDRGGVPYPDSINGIPVHQTGVIHHIRANAQLGGAWGVPDLLAGIFYAGEHKELIEAADSIFRAQSQYAVQYKTKTTKAFETVAAAIAGPMPIDPATGAPAQYGQEVAFGSDIEMQLMNKIGGGIDFSHFDPIAALASVALGVPVDVVLGKEEATESTLPFASLQRAKSDQRFWTDQFLDIFEQMGKKRADVKVSWPKINPDPTHRQVQSIAGIAKLKIAKPEEVRELAIATFGVDWEAAVPDPKEWEDFESKQLAPGAVEGGDGPITPGQGQTGQLGQLADGDHELRDEGQQDSAPKKPASKN